MTKIEYIQTEWREEQHINENVTSFQITSN